jgi:hypothetical protein
MWENSPMSSNERIVMRWATIFTGIGLFFFPFFGFDAAQAVSDRPWATLFVSSGGALLCLLSIYNWLRYRSEVYRKTLTIHTEEGESAIALFALEKILLDTLKSFTDIHDVRADLSVKGPDGTINCALTFKMDSQGDIPGRTDDLKRVVRDTFSQLIPIPIDLQIICRVEDLLLPKAKEDMLAPSSVLDTFSGPVYPVIKDEERTGREGY